MAFSLTGYSLLPESTLTHHIDIDQRGFLPSRPADIMGCMEVVQLRQLGAFLNNFVEDAMTGATYFVLWHL